MGTIRDIFDWDGTILVASDIFNSLVIDGAILAAVFLSMLAEMLSWPLDLD